MINLYYAKIGNYWFAVALENEKVVATAFSQSKEQVLKRLLKDIPYGVPFQLVEEQTSLAKEILSALKTIFEGKEIQQKFNLEMKYLPPYQGKVLRRLLYVPVGYVTTYGALAKVCGGSPRAVGQAMARNPMPLLIPCHRVVRSDMSIGGFGYGVKVKWEILRREDRGYEKPSKLEVAGKNLILYPVKYVKAPSLEDE